MDDTRMPNIGLWTGQVHKSPVHALGPDDVIWLRRSARMMCGYEKAALQGWCFKDVCPDNLQNNDHTRLGQLAGDGFNLYSAMIHDFALLATVKLPPSRSIMTR